MKISKPIQITFILCALAVLAVKNLDNIYSCIANHYYKMGDIKQAQEYFEKSFAFGSQNLKDKDIYVTSIINSPFDLDAQIKLDNFLNKNADEFSKQKAEYFIYDLKRELHKKYPNNYIFQAPYNQKIMRWSNTPITYSFINTDGVPEYFIQEIENAFTEWEKATDHKILFSKESANGNIIVDFNRNELAETDAQKYVVAYTVPDVQSDFLNGMKITFHLQDNSGSLYSKNQVYNTALHEILHALGFMGHSNDEGNVLYISKNSYDILNDNRDKPSEADINSIKLLYDIKPEITNSQEDSGSSYMPFLVFGENEDINNAKLREAKYYIRHAPDLPNGYIDLAEIYMLEKQYSKAIKTLETAERLSNSDDVLWIVYHNLAIAYFYINYMELSEEYLQKALEIKDSENMQYLKGEIAVKNKNYKNAIKCFETLLGNNPQNIDYMIALANVYVVQKQYFKARNVIKQFIKNNPAERNNKRLESYGILRMFL